MVIKGSSRGQSASDVRRLAAHLLAAENEAVEVAEVAGVAAGDLHAALAEMRAVSLGSRTRKAVYHASINVDRNEGAMMTRARWMETVGELEHRLGLAGHPRAVVFHRKHERDHVHVVWGRVDPLTLKAVSDSQNYRIHEECSRALEERFGFRRVIGPYTRRPGVPRPTAKATHADWQAAERTGIAVEDVAARMHAAWLESNTGTAFRAALEARGLSLAKGRRGLLAVDEAGTPHSIARRLGLKAAVVRAKLADIGLDDVPALNEARTTRRKSPMKKIVIGAAGPACAAEADWEALEDYWRRLGYAPVRQWNCLWVDVDGASLRDSGDRLEIHGTGEPTDAQIAAMVAAGRARGWTTIHFYGGSEAFQHRARLEALRQGFPPEAISLECDPGGGSKPPDEAMPEHLRRKLGLPEHGNTRNTENTEEQAYSPRFR
ncbi:relaxase/mobilization nuclease domain-containing protein [Azospirillum brasilense]|nr:relaxase/mobilization nuclease domain-containing protein [Azospirillum brasilense]